MNSEFAVDEEIKKLQTLATSPQLYSTFLRLKGLDIVIPLLSHENTGMCFVEDLVE